MVMQPRGDELSATRWVNLQFGNFEGVSHHDALLHKRVCERSVGGGLGEGGNAISTDDFVEHQQHLFAQRHSTETGVFIMRIPPVFEP